VVCELNLDLPKFRSDKRRFPLYRRYLIEYPIGTLVKSNIVSTQIKDGEVWSEFGTSEYLLIRTRRREY